MDFNKMTIEELVVYTAIKDNISLDEYWESVSWCNMDCLEPLTTTATGCNQKSQWKNMTQSSISSEVAIGFWLEKIMSDKHKDQYEDNLFWWRRYSLLGEELGAIINEQQDIILTLQRENKRLKRENWNLKQTKGRK